MNKEYITELNIPEVDSLAQSMRHSYMDYAKQNNEPILIQKALVGRFGGLKVEIFSNEHPPPHFRVKFQGSTANYTISNCQLIDGSREILRYEKCIKQWWKENKQKLIDCWDNRRPSDCPVGLYREAT